MTVLVDSNALLFALLAPDRLSEKAKKLMEDRGNHLVWSAASTWEIVIKVRLGKLQLDGGVTEVLPEQLNRLGMQVLPVEQSHALRVAGLPDVVWTDTAGIPRRHADPFDRLLVAQAQVENLPILSADEQFDRYEVTRMW